MAVEKILFSFSSFPSPNAQVINLLVAAVIELENREKTVTKPPTTLLIP